MGIAFILLGMLCIATEDMLIKQLSGAYPLHQTRVANNSDRKPQFNQGAKVRILMRKGGLNPALLGLAQE